jgi:hypothetical protein
MQVAVLTAQYRKQSDQVDVLSAIQLAIPDHVNQLLSFMCVPVLDLY